MTTFANGMTFQQFGESLEKILIHVEPFVCEENGAINTIVFECRDLTTRRGLRGQNYLSITLHDDGTYSLENN